MNVTNTLTRVATKCAILLALAAPFAVCADDCAPEHARRVQIGTQTWPVEVAATPAARTRGLSGRARLAPGTGMWFVMPQDDLSGFWMKDMLFSLDIIWVSPAAQVADVRTLAPCTAEHCPVYVPLSAAAYVLEVDAGSFAGQRGDTVRWHCQ